MVIINFDFGFWIEFKRDFISSFVRTLGILFSRFGLFIPKVMSFSSRFKDEYFIADKNWIIVIEEFSVRFSARYNFTSSVVISLGCFFVKSRRDLFARI